MSKREAAIRLRVLAGLMRYPYDLDAVIFELHELADKLDGAKPF